MSEHSVSKGYSHLVNALVFIFALFVNINNHVADAALIFLALSSLYAYRVNGNVLFQDRRLRLLMVITIGYYLINLIIYFINGTYLAKYLQTDLYFILAVFVAFSILNAKINLNLFFFGLRLALILLGICHLSSINCSNIYISIGAPVTILMMFLSVINFDNDSTANKILGLVAFMFGFMISVESGIRLAWLVFAVLSVIFIVFTLKEKQVFKSFTMMILFVVFVGGIIFSISNSSKIDNRITHAANQISAWSDASHKLSSIGLRLEMYKSSIEAFKEKPLFGHGYRMGTKVTAKYVDESLKNKVFGFVQLHSEYMTTLVEKGLVGLIATGFLLLLPLLFAIRNYDINNIFIRIGLVTSISFILFGTFNVSFGDTTYKALYVFLICLYLPKIYKKS